MLALYVHAIQLTHRLRRDTKAVTAVEYGLIASLIAVAIIVAVTALGQQLSAVFTSISGKLTAAT